MGDGVTTGWAVMETIRGYGIDVIFGIPGTHNLELYRPLAQLGIRAVTTRHEQGAGYAADAWHLRTGLPGVVVTTSGPGLQNVMSAVGTAFCESRAMLVVSPGVALGAEFADVGTLHETKNATQMAGAVAAWSRRVESGAEAVEAVHEAMAAFRSVRPRPVHIEIPLDVLEGPSGVDAEARAPRPAPAEAPIDEEAIRRAALALARAERPAILVGGGGRAAGAEVRTLATLIDAPIITTLNGKGTVPESDPRSIGSNLRLEAVRSLAEDADVLLVIGSKLGEAELWAPSLQPRGTVVRIDISEAQLRKNLADEVDVIGLVGEARACAARIASLIEGDAAAGAPAGREPSDARIARTRAALIEEARDLAPEPMELARRIARALPEGTIVAGDSSQIDYMGMGTVFASAEPGQFLYMATYATLGYGLPAGIGAKVASPDKPVAVAVGDGALMFSVNELATAIEQGLDLVVICVDNGGYAEIAENQRDRGYDEIGVKLAQPDWAALCTAFGGGGIRVAEGEDPAAAIRAAFDRGGVQLVHIQMPWPLGRSAD